MNKKTPGFIFIPLFLLYGFGFSLFYLTYVPLITSFQLVLAPFLVLVFALVLFDFERGTLFFIFLFPLINSLPYFFHIYGNIPHAPTCLVLFLAYFFGWLGRRMFVSSSLKGNPSTARPMVLFLCLCFVSAVVTFFRYAAFFPFRTDRIYELTANLFGVSSGGAIMSVVFNFLSYFSGFMFFIILLGAKPSRRFVFKMMLVLTSSALIALSVGMVQRFGDGTFGNNLISIRHGLINGTFKDALSFGAFISMTVPLFLGLFLYLKNLWRFVLAAAILLSVFLLFFTGSKSALLSLILSLFVFIRLVVPAFRKRKNILPVRSGRKGKIVPRIVLAAVAVGLIVLILFGNIGQSSSVSRLGDMFQRGVMDLMISWRGPLWQSAVLMWADYPLTGVGIGGYIIELPEYLKLHGFPLETPQSAENYFLQAGAETGAAGLFCILWLLIGFIIRFRRGFKSLSYLEEDAFLWAGAAAGVVSFFVNGIFHTYIGSYEIKAVFWLLAALLFLLGPEYGPRPGRKIFGRWFFFLGVFFIAAFGFIHARNSLGPLSLKTKTEKYHLSHDFGFYEAEKTESGRMFRWTDRRAGKSLRVKKKTMVLDLHASHPDIHDNPVSVKIFLVKDFFSDKKLLRDIILSDTSWKSLEVDLRGEVGKEHILLFEVGRTWNPMKEKGIPDPRDLGIAVGRIRFTGRTARR